MLHAQYHLIQSNRHTEGAAMTRAIDMHGHLLNQDYLDLLSAHGALQEDGFPLPTFDEDATIAFMDENDIELQLLSLSSPQPFFGDAAESAAFCRRFNNWTAEVVARHPGRFAFCAVLPLPDVDAACAEAIRAMDELGAAGVKLASNSRGLYLGDAALDPLFAEVDKRGKLAIIHPHRPEPLREGLFTSGPVPLYEFLADTTRAVLNMIAHEVPARFPNAHIVVPHCGSFLPNVAARIQTVQPLLVAMGAMEPIDFAGNVGKLYFDLAGNPVPTLLPLLASVADPSHILYGSDFPFTNAAIAGKGIAALREFLANDAQLSAHADAIMRENALGLL